MPRTLDPDLLDCLRREDSYTELAVEIAAPDVGQVLRRAVDQLLVSPPIVAGTQVGTMAQTASGGVGIAATSAALATHAGSDATQFDLNREDDTTRVKGLLWTVDPAFVRARLRTVRATVTQSGVAGIFPPSDFALQIYRISVIPGDVQAYNAQRNTYSDIAVVQHAFTPLLNPAAPLPRANISWASNQATLSFDLSSYDLWVENTPGPAASPSGTGELPAYLFSIQPLQPPGTGFFHWLVSTAGAYNAGAGIGTFRQSWWGRKTADATRLWYENTGVENNCPAFEIDVDGYGASAQAVYALDLGRAPTAGTTGRVVFERTLPTGTNATLELATAGSTGPWTTVQDGDAVLTAQELYWLRLTLDADSAARATPFVAGIGVEFRTPYDVSAVSVAQLPTRDISVPDLKASIASAQLAVLRDGVPDYRDTATVLGSTAATSKLEADIFLRSRHPLVFTNRAKWLRLERMLVDDRDATKTAERYTLLSITKQLGRKVPAQVETVNSVQTVTSSTTMAVHVVGPLPGTSVGGHEYNGLGYYLRVRTTSVNGIAPGSTFPIAGSNGTQEIDLAGASALPVALAAGDVVEVHSGVLATEPLSWQDADPADVWYGLLVAAGIATDRIGRSDLPRSGYPPRVTDVAPGDATTQAKRKVSMRVKDQETAGDLLDQISYILGGATVEIGGQFCFVQIYPGRALDGTVTVPLPSPAAVFDARDIVAGTLGTKPNVSQRKVTATATYGVNNAAADPSQYPTQTTNATDADALVWLAQQDLDLVGSTALEDKICRWFYNSTDQGLYLASVCCAQLVRACSTGVRRFPFRTREDHPELRVGDVVTVITNQYTDYDPATGTSFSGTLAIRGVVIHQAGLREFAIFVLGLTDNVTGLAGGGAGVLTGLGDLPATPTVTESFDSAGHVLITAQSDGSATGLKIGYSATSAAAALAAAQAAATVAVPTPGGIVDLLTTDTFTAGTLVYVAVLAVSGSGLTSTAAQTSAYRGVSTPPSQAIVPTLTNNQVDDTTSPVTLSASATNLPATYTWAIYAGYSKGQYSGAASWSGSNSASPLPFSANVTPGPKNSSWYKLVITVGTDTYVAESQVQGRWSFIDGATGNPLRTQPYTDGGYATRALDSNGLNLHGSVTDSGGSRAVNRFWAKGLSGDPDTLDSAPDGTTYGRPLLVRLSSGKPWIDFAEGIHANKVADYIGDGSTHGITTLTDRTNLINTLDATGVKTGKVVRARGFDDGYYALQANNTAGTSMLGTAQDSGGRLANRFYAKGLSGDPDTADAFSGHDGLSLRVTTLNEATGGGRGYSALSTGNRLVTGVDSGADIVGASAGIVATGVSTSLFRETFETDPFSTGRWAVLTGATPGLNLGGGIVGPNFIYANAFSGIEGSAKIPYNATKLHRFRIALYQNGAAGTAGVIYAGIRGTRADGTDANSNSGVVYVCLKNFTPPINGWKTYTGWFTGASVAYTTASDPAPDAYVPAQLNVNTVSIVPFIYLNYPSGTTNQWLGYVEIDVLDEDASGRVYGALASGRQVAAGVTQFDSSGTRPMMRGYQVGSYRHGDSVTFSTPYANTPKVRISGGIKHEPRGLWGTNGGTSPVNTALPQIEDFGLDQISKSGGVMRARLRQPGTTAPGSDAWSGTTQVTTAGAVTSNRAPTAVANNGVYSITGTLAINQTYEPSAGGTQTVSATVAMDVDPLGNGGWVEVATQTLSTSSSSGNVSRSVALSLSCTRSDVTTSSQFRLRMKTVSDYYGLSTETGTASALTYTTATGDQYANATYDTGVTVTLETWEGDSAS